MTTAGDTSPYPDIAVVLPPAALISTADAKTHLRVETSDDDAYIDALVAAATQVVDGPKGWLGARLDSRP